MGPYTLLRSHQEKIKRTSLKTTSGVVLREFTEVGEQPGCQPASFGFRCSLLNYSFQDRESLILIQFSPSVHRSQLLHKNNGGVASSHLLSWASIASKSCVLDQLKPGMINLSELLTTNTRLKCTLANYSKRSFYCIYVYILLLIVLSVNIPLSRWVNLPVTVGEYALTFYYKFNLNCFDISYKIHNIQAHKP